MSRASLSSPSVSNVVDEHTSLTTTKRTSAKKNTTAATTRPSRAAKSSSAVAASSNAASIPSLNVLASGAFLDGTRAAIGFDDNTNNDVEHAMNIELNGNDDTLMQQDESHAVSVSTSNHYTRIDQASQAFQSTFVLNDASNRHRYRSNLVSHCTNFVVGKTRYPLRSPYACMFCVEYFDSVPFKYVRGAWDAKLGVFKQVCGNFCSAGCMLAYLPLHHPYEWRYLKVATVAFLQQALGVDISRVSAAPSTARLAKHGGNLSPEEFRVPCADLSSTVLIDDARWTSGVTFFQVDTLNSERATRAQSLIDRLHPEWSDEDKARVIRDSLPMHATAHPEDTTIVWYEPTQSFIDVHLLAYYNRQSSMDPTIVENDVVVAAVVEEDAPKPSHAVNAYTVVHPPPQVHFMSNLFMLPAYEPGESLMNVSC